MGHSGGFGPTAEERHALAGVRVLDLTGTVAGAVAGMLLADLGADVVKVHPPGPPGQPGHAMWDRGKRAVTADPSVMADQMKLFGRAFQFEPLTGVHLVSAGRHHGGCQGFYHGALNVGQALAIMGRFDAERALGMISEHRVTTAYMVPTQFVRLLRLPATVRDAYDVSSLRVVVHSAAPCPREVKQQMMDWWGPVIWETYGGMEGAEIASNCGVSERTLTRRFTEATGLTPLRYQQLLRRERAEHLIGHGATVEAAARTVGFQDARMLRRLRAREPA